MLLPYEFPYFTENALGFVQCNLGHIRKSIERCAAFPMDAYRPMATWPSERDWKARRVRSATRCTLCRQEVAFPGIASSTRAARSACDADRIRMSCSGYCSKRKEFDLMSRDGLI